MFGWENLRIILRAVFGGGADISAANPLQVFDPKVFGSVGGLSLHGTVTAIPGANQFTIPTLAGLGAGKFADATAPYRAFVLRDADGAGALPQGEMRTVTGYITATGTFTTAAFSAAVAVNDEILIIHPRLAEIATTLADMGLTTFSQLTAPATNVNGVTWEDLYDGSAITNTTEICGIMLTVAGVWAGLAKFRITNGVGTKIFPFQAEYVQGTDWTSATQLVFNFKVKVRPTNGFKVQFRSTNAGDGAGETVAMNNLDIITRS